MILSLCDKVTEAITVKLLLCKVVRVLEVTVCKGQGVHWLLCERSLRGAVTL